MTKSGGFVVFAWMACVALGPLAVASAQSGSLYGASVEESAILVRLINAGAVGSPSFRMGPARLQATAPGTITAYQAIPEDLYELSYLGRSIEFQPQRQTLYTLVAGPESLTILTDTRHQDPVRAQVYLYHAGPASLGPLSLKTADGSATLVDGVLPGASGFRAVNALTVSLALFDAAGKARSKPFSVVLTRGASFTVMGVWQPDGQLIPYTAAAGIAAR